MACDQRDENPKKDPEEMLEIENTKKKEDYLDFLVDWMELRTESQSLKRSKTKIQNEQGMKEVQNRISENCRVPTKGVLLA